MSARDVRSVASVFDPTRLRIARQAAMLRKNELAERIGVSPAAISQYESGTTSPAAKTVAALSLALGVPADYFIADRPLGEAPTTTAHFRSLRATTQQERARAFAHALQTWELSCTLEQFVRFPPLTSPPTSPSILMIRSGRLKQQLGPSGRSWVSELARSRTWSRLLESRGESARDCPHKRAGCSRFRAISPPVRLSS